jgi:hypothetical protein
MTGKIEFQIGTQFGPLSKLAVGATTIHAHRITMVEFGVPAWNPKAMF